MRVQETSELGVDKRARVPGSIFMRLILLECMDDVSIVSLLSAFYIYLYDTTISPDSTFYSIPFTTMFTLTIRHGKCDGHGHDASAPPYVYVFCHISAPLPYALLYFTID